MRRAVRMTDNCASVAMLPLGWVDKAQLQHFPAAGFDEDP
jgi:hypothetical protein